MASSPAETRVFLFHLPAELYRKIVSYLKKDTLKNLRLTCSTLNKLTPFIIERVFISANSLNLQVFRAIADSETFRHKVTEIIWDDARLSEGPEDAIERRNFRFIGDEDEIVTDNGCPLWFKARRQDTDEPVFEGSGIFLNYKNLSVEASWEYYKGLLDDQRHILQTGADIEAFKHGLTQFPNLKRITVTPSTHGNIGQPVYQTPMIRAFPPRFDYPLPKEWPKTRGDKPRQEFPWILDEHNDPLESFDFHHMHECTPEQYRAKWRGFRVILRTLVENGHKHNVTEFIVGGKEVLTGLNCRLFDQPCQEYDDLVTLLKRPGFRRLALDLFTGMNERRDWISFRSGLVHKALSEAKDLRHITLHTTTHIINGKAVHPPPNIHPGHGLFPLRAVFPINCWPHLEHFGISNIMVRQEDLLSFLAALPYSTRSVDLGNLAWANEDEDYHSLLDKMRTRLDWRSRPVGDRPKLHLTVSPTVGSMEIGLYVEVDDSAHAFLYDNGENPFRAGGSLVLKGIQKALSIGDVSPLQP